MWSVLLRASISHYKFYIHPKLENWIDVCSFCRFSHSLSLYCVTLKFKPKIENAIVFRSKFCLCAFLSTIEDEELDIELELLLNWLILCVLLCCSSLYTGLRNRGRLRDLTKYVKLAVFCACSSSGVSGLCWCCIFFQILVQLYIFYFIITPIFN